MKIKILFILPVVLFLIQSCSENKEPAARVCRGGSYELSFKTGKDTFNLIDCENNKQGHWVIFKWVVLNKQNGPERIADEEGFYKDNKKQGFWKKFSPIGKVLDSVEYKDGVAIVK
ncbi:MAG TPA: hypothetical protein VN026_00555 [Bacteroidia bacterium]|jgi:hypothetical protein|nr:hypothetical protein [Bacteroidia bacterium]